LPRASRVPPALDREAFGADCSALLGVLAGFETACGPEGGYAFGRPGTKAVYFGPCVARSHTEARQLLAWFLGRHAAETVYWDLLPGNTAALELARECGFAPLRRLVRMVRRGAGAAAPLTHRDGLVFGVAGFEFG
jgi:hypothetical protein